MRLNYEVLQTGDVYFVQKLGRVRCSQIITPYGHRAPLLYGCEITTDITGVKKFNIVSLSNKNIISIMRPSMAYNSKFNQIKLNMRMIDFKYLCATGSDVLDLINSMPCQPVGYDVLTQDMSALLVYSNLVQEGEPIRNAKFDTKITVEDLYNHELLTEIENWRI